MNPFYYNRHVLKTFGFYIGVFIIVDALYSMFEDPFPSLNFWIDVLMLVLGITVFSNAMFNKHYSDQTLEESKNNNR